MKIIQNILTKNPCYIAGEKITVKGLMLHSVGCNQPSAEVFIKQWNPPNGRRVCVHAFIDGNTGYVHQTLPWNHRGWHGGGDCNDTHIGVEMCEPACIKYKGVSDRFTCSDVGAAQAVVQRTYDSAVQLFAHLCKQYNLNPLGDGVIVSHNEGHKRGIASGHSDPEHLWTQLGMGYTMDTFRKAVKNAMGNTSETGDTGSDEVYRVQVGSFSNVEYAEKLLEDLKKDGYNGFIVKDKVTSSVAPEITFAVGDKVKMSSNATIYGKTTNFYDWVYNSTLYVREVDGNRIVISTQKTGDITGAVDKKYLKHV